MVTSPQDTPPPQSPYGDRSPTPLALAVPGRPSPPRECLRQVINYSEEPEVACPFRDDSYACGSHLQEREIRAVSASRGGAGALGGGFGGGAS